MGNEGAGSPARQSLLGGANPTAVDSRAASLPRSPPPNRHGNTVHIDAFHVDIDAKPPVFRYRVKGESQTQRVALSDVSSNSPWGWFVVHFAFECLHALGTPHYARSLLPECKYTALKPLDEALLLSMYERAREKGSPGYLHFAVVGLPSIVSEACSFRAAPDTTTSFSYQANDGFIEVAPKSCHGDIQLPDLPLPGYAAGSAGFENDWLKALENHPKATRYVIGNQLPDIELHPGATLERRGPGPDALQGVQTTYTYFNLSKDPHVTAIHKEDCDFNSINVLLSGAPKDWLIVHPDDTGKFESCMRERFQPEHQCAQFVRHIGVSVSPERLASWGVRYTIVRCMPGEAIMTGPVYHQVLNQGRNFAVAINAELTTMGDEPRYRFCDRKICDPHAITAEDVRIRGHNRTTPIANGLCKKRPAESRPRANGPRKKALARSRGCCGTCKMGGHNTRTCRWRKSP